MGEARAGQHEKGAAAAEIQKEIAGWAVHSFGWHGQDGVKAIGKQNRAPCPEIRDSALHAGLTKIAEKAKGRRVQ
jgi:hypothetical protein